MRKIAIVSILTALGFSSLPAYALDPGQMLVQVYAVAVSANSNCTNPSILFYSGIPTDVDFMKNPNLGGGSVADGTYPCVIISMSDQIRFSSSTTSGSCTAGAVHTVDICQAGSTSAVLNGDGTFGTSIQCSGTSLAPQQNIVTLFLTTASTTTSLGLIGLATAFQLPGVNGGLGVNLAAPFVVSGSTAGTFAVNGTGHVDGSGTVCTMAFPTFGFH